MVAPIDAKAEFEVEGETVTLRFNFQAIALADQHGIDLLNDGFTELRPVQAATLLKCLGAQDQPDWTEDHALAVVVKAPEMVREALISLFTEYGGKAEGNGKRRKAKGK
ncbi:hypothetical protein [Tsuneonella suprasediminis]|uniref:hypothetical protein n=1 Tax=Tsuneonella suprasediminis TaxID=2306996 RepID=UPI002F935B9E